MRIITGKFKGRQLKAPKTIRPTEDRIRTALFDIIDPEKTAFLELFAGSGAVGLEALSRGAARVTFVEKEGSCAKMIEENSRQLGAGQSGQAGQVEIVTTSAEQIIPFFYQQGRKFDIIFLDPPYYRGLSENILQMLGGYDILLPSGMIIIQHFRKDPLSETAGGFAVYRQEKYGDSLLSFYHKTGQHEQESDIPGDV
jgi:16S rRNA (guanine966-N2)-methyltransferase